MVYLHCGRIEVPDLRSVQVLAAATLRTRREGGHTRLAFVSSELRQLIAFVGLDGVLVLAAGFPPRSSGGDDLRRPGAAAAQTAETASPYPGRR
jgi:hypothetical protein